MLIIITLEKITIKKIIITTTTIIKIVIIITINAIK